jgi:molybdenum cofactor guanylyltransferase
VRRLGAVIAGGKSTRFGDDKASAIIDGFPLIDHVVMGLYHYVDAIVIAGRDWRDFDVVKDGKFAGQGPLAGLLAALTHANANGFDSVISAACDALPVPDLGPLVGGGPAVIEGHWLFGFWPVKLAPFLADYLVRQKDRSMRGWINHCSARRVAQGRAVHNLNSKADFMLYEQSLEHRA